MRALGSSLSARHQQIWSLPAPNLSWSGPTILLAAEVGMLSGEDLAGVVVETKGLRSVDGISSAIRIWYGRHDCPVMAEVETGRGRGVLRAVLKSVPLWAPQAWTGALASWARVNTEGRPSVKCSVMQITFPSFCRACPPHSVPKTCH